MEVEHPSAGDGPGNAPGFVDVNGDRVSVDEDGVFEVDDEGWLRRFAERHDVAPEDLVREEDGPPDDEAGENEGDGVEEDVGLSFEPGDHTVDEIRDHVESIDGDRIVAELEAIRAAEADGQARKTALEAIDSRLDDLED